MTTKARSRATGTGNGECTAECSGADISSPDVGAISAGKLLRPWPVPAVHSSDLALFLPS